MNAKKPLVIAFPALLCGALLGYFLPHAAPEPVPAAPAARPERPERKTTQKSDDAIQNQLRRRIRDLERQLAEKSAPEDAPAAGMPAEEETRAEPAEPRRRGMGGWPQNAAAMRAHLEEMRQNDPERYARTTNWWANVRAQGLAHAQSRLDILASVDLAQLSPKQREVHEQYQNLIARNEEIMDLMDLKNADVTDEQRDELGRVMFENHGKMRELARAEREALLSHTATSFGVKGPAAKELVETVKAVYEATDNWGGRGGRGRGPGGRGHGGPGGRR